MTTPNLPLLSNFKPYGADREINECKIKLSRPLLRIHYTKPRQYFIDRHHEIKLSTTDAMEHTHEYRPFKDPTYERLGQERGVGAEHCIGIQAVCTMKDARTQTSWFRKVNTAIQMQTEGIDARLRPGEDTTTEDTPRINAFLRRVLPRIEHNCVSNIVLQLFRDDYSELMDDDTFLGNKDDAAFSDAGNFQHHRYTKNKTVTSMDWHPRNTRMVAISIGESIGPNGQPFSYTDRIYRNRKVLNSLVVIWEFNDPIHPRWLLESPQEINVVKFNPTNPDIIVGGAINGQVVLWDLGKHTQGRSKGKKAGRDREREKGVQDADEGVGESTPKLPWKEVSKIESGHKRAINDLWWITGGLECNFDGKLIPSGQAGSEANRMKKSWGGTEQAPFVFEGVRQFVTLSADGYMFIWDVNKENMRKDKYRKLVQGRQNESEIPWLPLIKIPLTKPDGSGEVIGLRLFMEDKSVDPYLACVATEEGEFVHLNWSPTESASGPSYGAGDDAGKFQPVKMCAGLLPDGRRVGHHGPAYAVQRHPMLPKYYLTAGDWSFKIWKLGSAHPVVCSPFCDAQVTAGCWSPTRPSVVFIGTADGNIQVWDLLDRSHEPILTQAVSQDAITAMSFKPAQEGKRHAANERTEALAVGTRIGFLHIFRLPKVMVKPKMSEKADMERYLEREAQRVSYFTGRWEKRAKELEAKNAALQQESLSKQLELPRKDLEEDDEEDNPFADPGMIEVKIEEFKARLAQLEEES